MIINYVYKEKSILFIRFGGFFFGNGPVLVLEPSFIPWNDNTRAVKLISDLRFAKNKTKQKQND